MHFFRHVGAALRWKFQLSVYQTRTRGSCDKRKWGVWRFRREMWIAPNMSFRTDNWFNVFQWHIVVEKSWPVETKVNKSSVEYHCLLLPAILEYSSDAELMWKKMLRWERTYGVRGVTERIRGSCSYFGPIAFT